MEETQDVYADELLADTEWLVLYEKERRKDEELDTTLKKHIMEQKKSQSERLKSRFYVTNYIRPIPYSIHACFFV